MKVSNWDCLPRFDRGVRWPAPGGDGAGEGTAADPLGSIQDAVDIEVLDSTDVVVRDSVVHGVSWGIRVRKSARVTVEDNLVHDEMAYGLDWRPGGPTRTAWPTRLGSPWTARSRRS